MINVNGIKRNAKNLVKKYSDAQVKVREATSNDPWGPSSTIMAEIADLTYNVVAFSEIMQMIWKRLNDHGKNWRHVYKALVLLEYLIKTGTEKVGQQCIENIFAIQTLKDFQYMEDNKDYGMNIREKSKKLVALLKDSEKLKAERARALKAKARLAEAMSSVGKNSLGAMMSASGNNGDMLALNGNNHMSSHLHTEGGSSSSGSSAQQTSVLGMAGSDIDSARPSSLTEEEQQLRLALALSKEEAEQQEKTRKHDELRLKLALDVSKKSTATPTATTSSSAFLIDDFNEPSTSDKLAIEPQLANQEASVAPPVQSKSAIDDLLGLSITPTAETTPKSSLSLVNSQSLTNPVNNSSALTSSAISSIFPEPQNDPWSTDPWLATSTKTTPSQHTSTYPAQQATGFNLTPSTLSTVPTFPITNTPRVTGADLSNFTILSDSNEFFSNNNNNPTNNNRRQLSKNPFQD